MDDLKELTRRLNESEATILRMNQERAALFEEVQAYRNAARLYGIDPATMLTLAKSQVKTCADNIRLIEKMQEVFELFRYVPENLTEYYFLSNFYSAPVTYNGMCFENNEAAFQAAKCPERMTEFCRLNPSEAKRLGRRVKLRGDWEAVKDTVMYEICKAKFSQNPDLADQLVATKDAELIEGNTWGDRIWGVCDVVGENRLGKILMRIRAEM